MEKLMELVIKAKDSKYSNKHLVVYGEVEIITDTHYNKIEFKYPEIENINIVELVDGKEIEFSISGTTWAGRNYDFYDVVLTALADAIRNDFTIQEVLYMCPALQSIKDSYNEIALNVEGLDIPKNILHGYCCDFYQLDVVTDKYICYFSTDTFLMLSTKDHSIISDNYFAEVGYWDSKEKVEKGEEKLLYGEFPKED